MLDKEETDLLVRPVAEVNAEEPLSTFEINYDAVLESISGGSFGFWNFTFFMFGMLSNNWFVNAFAFDE